MSDLGFKDPDGAFPREEYIGKATTNKAAREEWEPKIVLPDGVEGADLIKTDWQPKYPHNKVEETSSGHRIEHDDTQGGERLSYVHKDGSGIEMYPKADEQATMLINSVGKMVHLVGDDFTMIVNANGDITYKGNLNINVEGDFNVSCNNYTVTTKGKQVEEIEQEKVENFVGDRIVTTQGNKSEVVLGNYTVESMNNSYFISKKSTRITAESDIDIYSGRHMTLTAKENMTSSALANRLVGICTSILGSKGTIGGENMVMYGKTYHGDLIGTAQRARYMTSTDPVSEVTAMPTEANLTEGQTKTYDIGIRKPVVVDESIKNSVQGGFDTGGATSPSDPVDTPETFEDGEIPETSTKLNDEGQERSGVGDFDPNDVATERYNNPGAIYPSGWQSKYGAIPNNDIIGGGHSIAGFATQEGGAAAQMALLKEGKYYRNKSIADAINTWSGGNHVDAYLGIKKDKNGNLLPPSPNSLKGQGIDVTKNVSDYTKTKAGTIALSRAMSKWEGAGKSTLSDQGWSNAYDLGESKGWI